MTRSKAIIAAWSLGWLVYMVAMVLTVYDGIPSLIVQPVMAALSSTLAVGVALLVGFVLRIPLVGNVWSWPWAATLAGSSILIMCCGARLGITQTFIDPETGHQSIGLRSSIGLISYFILIFAVVNWPTRRSDAS